MVCAVAVMGVTATLRQHLCLPVSDRMTLLSSAQASVSKGQIVPPVWETYEKAFGALACPSEGRQLKIAFAVAGPFHIKLGTDAMCPGLALRSLASAEVQLDAKSRSFMRQGQRCILARCFLVVILPLQAVVGAVTASDVQVPVQPAFSMWAWLSCFPA